MASRRRNVSGTDTGRRYSSFIYFDGPSNHNRQYLVGSKMGKVSLANMKFWILNIIYIILGILLLPALSAQAQLRLPGGASLSIKISPEFQIKTWFRRFLFFYAPLSW